MLSREDSWKSAYQMTAGEPEGLRKRRAERISLAMKSWGARIAFGSETSFRNPTKLYAFSLVECHSRMMYVEFTHCQCFETFLRCHIHALQTMGARHLVYDNLATAVAEHEGNPVRFHPRFLAFARAFGFLPRACHVASPWEKGKVERACIGYLRQNFWPLRCFADLADVNRQVRQWLEEIDNQRLNRETRERPDERFLGESLLPVPALLPDYRDTANPLVRKDLRLEFDGNRYCVGPLHPQRRQGTEVQRFSHEREQHVRKSKHWVPCFCLRDRGRSWLFRLAFGVHWLTQNFYLVRPMTMTIYREPISRQQTALDQLVVLQLKSIVDSEIQLRRQYTDLLSSATLEDWQTWTTEMQQLRNRTDRLSRMLGALEGTYVPPSVEETTQAAA